MDKNQNLTSFQELTTTELNQITGGGWWENFLYSVNRYSHNITQGLHQPIQLYRDTRTLGLIFIILYAS